MDDYDFDDDFDDQTLAALDQLEKTLFNKKHISPAPNPPAKRRKTESGWRSSITAANNSFELDELPEITLCQNAYTFQQADNSHSPSLTPQAQAPLEADRTINNVPVASSSRNILRNTHIQSHGLSIPPNRPPPTSRSNVPSRPSLHRTQSSSRPISTRPRNSARLLEHITNALSNTQSEIPQQPQVYMPPRHTQTASNTPLPSTPVVATLPHPVVSPPVDNINEEIIAFQKQLEEMRLENEKIRAALKEADEARIAKVGEVAVLRRGIQKTAEDHASQMAKLKAAKEEVDTRQLNMQRELKEEIERLKTQFIFKQQEIESNARRPPMSVHARRNIREAPIYTQTPARGPRATGPSNVKLTQEATPVRAPSKFVAPRSPEKTRPSAMLPGFENSFLESTPKRQFNKGKTPINAEIHRPLFQDELRAQRSTQSESARPPSVVPDDGFGMDIDIPPSSYQHASKHLTSSSPTSSPITRNDDDNQEDIDMNEDLDEEDDTVDEMHFNWKIELTRLVLTHTHPSQSRSTLQILAEQATAASAVENYSLHLAQILEAIGTTPEHDYDRAIAVVARCLISIASSLNRCNLVVPLVPLLNLLSNLTYSLPSFNSVVLSQNEQMGNGPSVLVLLSEIIERLAVENHSDNTPATAAETLLLAESLCWRTPEDSVHRLDFFVRNMNILTVLLHNRQPSRFLVHAIRVMTLMCIYPHVARCFLSLPVLGGSGPEQSNEPAVATKIPQLDHLCYFLIDVSRVDEESVALKETVATLLIVLSQSHPDALAALASSSVVIPSLTMYLTQLSSAVWEEEQSLTSPHCSLSLTIKSLNQSVHLLHHLVFSVEPEIGLKSKLQHASSRLFNGITHMFIVTFGRLSYAPIPEWVEPDREYELSAIRDMARNLLDLVVDGPECDNIYAAYHDEEDEGDMEEELLGDT
ncbi:hypothetical protein C8R42DRAFT_456685 [Lentinula raphanica]|nr:hypothetical protein C8R42DRAFT_456685 [Lentinula raphanica]